MVRTSPDRFVLVEFFFFLSLIDILEYKDHGDVSTSSSFLLMLPIFHSNDI